MWMVERRGALFGFATTKDIGEKKIMIGETVGSLW